MKKIKSFLMVLSIIELFVFASCKDNYTPEQVKVVCNVVEKAKIKGVAKIEDKFVPKGTIIKLYGFKSIFFDYLESITVSDDEGHFESKNQYDVDTKKIFNPFTLKIDEDKPITFCTTVSALLVKEKAVYNFEGEAIIEGYAKLDSILFPSVPQKGEEVDLLSKKDNSNCKKESYDIIETMRIDDSNGHFKSQHKYNKQERSKYIMRITEKDMFYFHYYAKHISPLLKPDNIPQYIFK